MTLDQAKLKAIEYARRDGKPWYVVFDMQYQAVSDDDRRFFYAFHVVNFTADPVFLGRQPPPAEQRGGDYHEVGT